MLYESLLCENLLYEKPDKNLLSQNVLSINSLSKKLGPGLKATLLNSIKTLIVCLLVMNLSITSAQQDSETAEAIAGAMEAMDEFMLGFNARDMDAWAASLNYPHVRFASGSVTVWETAEEFKQRNPFANLGNSGWDHSHWLTREVTLAAPGKVHIATVFQRFNSANQVIGTYESLYIVTKVAGHWGTQARSSLAP
jgi:hypothetical protein